MADKKVLRSKPVLRVIDGNRDALTAELIRRIFTAGEPCTELAQRLEPRGAGKLRLVFSR